MVLLGITVSGCCIKDPPMELDVGALNHKLREGLNGRSGTW